jgi:trk system potassium uptake protein TrkH
MNYFILCRFLGFIVAMVAVALGLCVCVDVGDIRLGRERHSLSGNAISCGISAILAIVLAVIGRRARYLEILRREAMAIVGTGWIFAALLGSLPFLLCNHPLTPAQAFFESMSGFTTTGSTAISNLADYSNSILFWRALMHWIGGLGILVLFVALLAILGISGKRSLLGMESTVNLGDSSMARLKDFASRLILLYVGLTLVCWWGLWGLGVVLHEGKLTLFEALLYSFSTIATGGFAPHDNSVSFFDSPAVEAFLMVFMIIGSLNFLLLINLVTGHPDRSVGRTEAKAFLGLLAFGIVAGTIDVWVRTDLGGWAALREVAFPMVSMGTSTGFATSDYDQWPMFSRVVLLTLIIIGGCSGSTAGGLKVIRMVIALKLVRQDIIKAFRPHQVFTTKLDDRSVDSEVRSRVMLYIVMLAIGFVLSMVVLSLLEPEIEDFTTLIGAVVGTFFNMGPGFGAVGPTDNFSGFGAPGLIFLSLLMLLGRLEFYVVLALFSRTLWRKY